MESYLTDTRPVNSLKNSKFLRLVIAGVAARKDLEVSDMAAKIMSDYLKRR